MNWDQVAALLLGAAFGSRVMDGKKSLVARLGYGLVSYDLISNAFGTEPVLFGDGAQQSNLVKGRADPLKFQERAARTIEQRVAYVHEQMTKGVRDPAVYALAREVLSRKCGSEWCVPEKDHWGEATALFTEVKGRVRYTWDPVWYDAFQTPGKTLKLRTGDCDDYMALLGSMLITVGLNVRSRIIQTIGEPTWNHIYVMVNIPEAKTWRPLDLSVKQPAGWEVPARLIVRHKDFDVLEKSVPRIRAMAGA